MTPVLAQQDRYDQDHPHAPAYRHYAGPRRVAQSILLLRGKRVILDRELATIYGVPTGRLNDAVKRNIERFPEDFMFQLTRAAAELSRSQSAILNADRSYSQQISRGSRSSSSP